MKRSLLVLAVILVVAPAMAQVKDLSQIDQRLGPPNFGPVGGTNCSAPFVGIPDADPGCVSDTMNIADATSITNLTVVIQATHTWDGDLQFRLTHDDTATSAMVIDRPGYTTSGFGCSGDDYDVALNDANGTSVEDVCEAVVPAIAGDLSSSPDALSLFSGETLAGDWTMLVVDNAGGDTGTLDTWCVDETAGGDGGDGGTGTPATSTWGVIALIALFMGVSLFYLRKRGSATA
jgi:hypothetical protein